MPHLPVNHPARPYLRLLAGLVGLYILVFGVTGTVVTWGDDFFNREPTYVLGLRTNPAFSMLSVLAGLVLVGGAIYGRNLDHFLNLWGGAAFIVAGGIMMAVLHTPANFLNFALRNTVVSFLIGLALMLAGLYGKEGPRDLAAAEHRRRRGEIGDDQWEAVAHGQAAGDAERPGTARPGQDRPGRHVRRRRHAGGAD